MALEFESDRLDQPGRCPGASSVKHRFWCAITWSGGKHRFAAAGMRAYIVPPRGNRSLGGIYGVVLGVEALPTELIGHLERSDELPLLGEGAADNRRTVMASAEEFARLMKSEWLPIRHGPILDEVPVRLREASWDRIEGMLLGVAIGDALGNTTESMNPERRYSSYGEIRDYLSNEFAGGRDVGVPSDDTQMTFWTIEQLIADRGYEPEHLARRFAEQRIFGIGASVREFLSNFKAGQPWHQAGARSAGNGALMRISAMLVPHVSQPSKHLWTDTVLSTITTHRDEAAVISSVAFAAMLVDVLTMDHAPPARWWLDRFEAVGRPIQLGTLYRPRGGTYAEVYEGPFVDYVASVVNSAHESDLSTLDACNRWHSGAYLMETVPSVVYILMRYGNDPEEAVVRAVNDTRDNDTVAAIVGAAVGALHGRSALPQRWIDGLLGRTAEADDGRVFDLLEQAQQCFHPGGPT